jgi:hypothetical protein
MFRGSRRVQWRWESWIGDSGNEKKMMRLGFFLGGRGMIQRQNGARRRFLQGKQAKGAWIKRCVRLPSPIFINQFWTVVG